jgi:hypothetical protein
LSRERNGSRPSKHEAEASERHTVGVEADKLDPTRAEECEAEVCLSPAGVGRRRSVPSLSQLAVTARRAANGSSSVWRRCSCWAGTRSHRGRSRSAASSSVRSCTSSVHRALRAGLSAQPATDERGGLRGRRRALDEFVTRYITASCAGIQRNAGVDRLGYRLMMLWTSKISG